MRHSDERFTVYPSKFQGFLQILHHVRISFFAYFLQCEIGGVQCQAIRISYTGELGWEIYMPRDQMKPVYQSLMENGKHQS